MFNEPERLVPGRPAKLNLFVDLAIVLAVVTALTLILEPRADVRSTVSLAVALGSLWIILGLLTRHYDPRTLRASLEDAAVTSLLVGAPVLVLAVSEVLLPEGHRLPPLAPMVPALWIPLVALRFLVFRPAYRREDHCGDIIVVGTGPLGRATAALLAGRRGCRVRGWVEVPGDDDGASPGRVLGTLDRLEDVLTRHPVDEVFIALDPSVYSPQVERAAQACEALGLPFAMPVPSLRLGRARVNGNRVRTDGYIHFWSDEPKPYQQAAKRLIDIIAAAAALVVLSPLLLATVLAIKVTSRGPVFFRQERVGLRGRPFVMLKFRSMVVDAERKLGQLRRRNEQQGPVFKIRHDPRITAVGRFIRRFSIDELPQLFNVLTGDMSLVGPRPPIQSEVDQYESWQRRRLSVRPGLTCIWQVSGRNEIPFERWMILDMRYIDTWNLKLDLTLILKTIPAVLSARGAS